MKRKYEKKLILGINNNKEFIIDRFQNEWKEISEAAKRRQKLDKIINITKKSGVALGKMILGLAAVGGVLTAALVAPNIFVAVGHLGKNKYRGFFNEKSLKSSARYLKYKKYIKVIKKDKDIFEIYLEKSGNQKILQEGFNDLTIARPKGWDNCWRIIIFDIPNKHKWAREGFRERLKKLGFYRLQESVFIFPYDCQKEIEFLCSIFSICDYVRFIETKSLIFDDDVKNFFLLK